jgi:hypothetical protein
MSKGGKAVISHRSLVNVPNTQGRRLPGRSAESVQKFGGVEQNRRFEGQNHRFLGVKMVFFCCMLLESKELVRSDPK